MVGVALSDITAVVPANAGMNRSLTSPTRSIPCGPRERGDEPERVVGREMSG